MAGEFVKLVEEMRRAQKDYFEMKNSKQAQFKEHEIRRLLQACKRLEVQVDRAIIQFKDNARHLVLLDLTKRTDETPGAYNVQHVEETAEGS